MVSRGQLAVNKYMFAPNLERCKRDLTQSNSILYSAIRIIDYIADKGHAIVDDIKQADRLVVHAAQHPVADEYGILHIHGIYPTATKGKWNEGHLRINKDLATAAQHATTVIVPSVWMQRSVAREYGVHSHVVSWGIDPSEWKYKPNKDGYILWNKTRANDVCNPYPIEYLASCYPKQEFVSTFADSKSRVQTIGAMPRQQMSDVIHRSGIYLATVCESFGIGTLEAMACGKPVLGFAWGNTPHLVRHGIDGYIAPAGDFRQLAYGLEYILDNYDRLSMSAHRRAQEYSWDSILPILYDIYEDTPQREYKYEISVVVPSYNYEQYIGRCIDSIFAQIDAPSFEVIVVDDHSSDQSCKILRKDYGNRSNFRLVVNKTNIGTANTRNVGIDMAQGKYIVCLDSDDYIHPTLLKTLYDACAHRTSIVSYSNISFVDADDQPLPRHWDIKHYDYERLHYNQIPTCCMYSKRMWEIAGGYDGRYTPAEDAALWISMIMKGAIPKLATSQPLFVHTRHGSNQSEGVPIPNWGKFWPSVINNGYPYSIGSSVPGAKHMFLHAQPVLTFALIGIDPDIINVLEQIHYQSFKWWRCVLMSNHDHQLHKHKYAWVEQFGYERHPYNESKQHIDEEFVVYLHPSDTLSPDFAKLMLEAISKYEKFVYSGWKYPEYSRDDVRNGRIQGYNPIAMFPTEWLHKIDYFNISDIYVNTARAGFCGVRIEDTLSKATRKMPDFNTSVMRKDTEPMCCGYKPKKEKIQESNNQLSLVWAGSALASSVYGLVTKKYYGEYSMGDIIVLDNKDAEAMKRSGTVR